MHPFAITLALLAAGVFLIVGLLTGILKFLRMRENPEARAPLYVDIAHRASLFYSFASLVLARLLEGSPYAPALQIAFVGVPLFFFAATVARYVELGIRGVTTSQFRERTFITGAGTWLLIVGELGGVVAIVAGFAWSRLG